MITYEYPLSERVRTLLRLEDLFDKVTHFATAEGAMEHHVALVTLFEILEVAGRAELKFDLVQELERQRQILLSFRNNPDISEEALSGALYEIEQASALLLAMHGKIDQYGVRSFESEGQAPVAIHPNRPMSIRKRVQLPAGHVHVLHGSRQIETCQLSRQSRRVVRLDTGFAARLEQGLQSFVAECPDHVASV